ncbi:MAG: TlpA disulfide reductase family protein [Acidobacteriota bacterium]
MKTTTHTKPSRGYYFVLHAFLLALTASTVWLATQNLELRRSAGTPGTTRQALPEVDRTWPAQPVVGPGGSAESLHSPTSATGSLVFVFTTQCPACRQAIDGWKAVHTRYGQRMKIVGLALDHAEATWRYTEEHQLPYPVRVAQDPVAYGEALDIRAVPTTLFVDAGGTVRKAWIGPPPTEWLDQHLRTEPVDLAVKP